MIQLTMVFTRAGEKVFSVCGWKRLRYFQRPRATTGWKRQVLRNILRENPKVFYVTCGSRNLNLLFGVVVKYSVTAVNLFWKFTKKYIPDLQRRLVGTFKSLWNSSLQNPNRKQDRNVVKKASNYMISSFKFLSCMEIHLMIKLKAR
jgi:hypothetical protein